MTFILVVGLLVSIGIVSVLQYLFSMRNYAVRNSMPFLVWISDILLLIVPSILFLIALWILWNYFHKKDVAIVKFLERFSSWLAPANGTKGADNLSGFRNDIKDKKEGS